MFLRQRKKNGMKNWHSREDEGRSKTRVNKRASKGHCGKTKGKGSRETSSSQSTASRQVPISPCWESLPPTPVYFSIHNLHTFLWDSENHVDLGPPKDPAAASLEQLLPLGCSAMEPFPEFPLEGITNLLISQLQRQTDRKVNELSQTVVD